MKMLLSQIPEIAGLFTALDNEYTVKCIYASGVYMMEFLKKHEKNISCINKCFLTALFSCCYEYENKTVDRFRYIQSDLLNKLSNHISEGYSFLVYKNPYFNVELHKLPASSQDYEVKKHGLDISLDQALIKAFRATEELYLNLP